VYQSRDADLATSLDLISSQHDGGAHQRRVLREKREGAAATLIVRCICMDIALV